MTLTLFAHPFSSYCQKVLMALWENDTPFTYRHMEEPGAGEDLARLWPIKKFPVLVDGDRTVIETSIIIEYLDQHHPGEVRFLPGEAAAGLEVRLLDRFFDQHVMNAAQVAVNESLRQKPDRLDEARQSAAQALEIAYGWLEQRLGGRAWAAGDQFSLADCAAAPSLFYADWVHLIDDATYPRLRAYRTRLLARPSFARAVEEGRKYRSYFPLGAPDRD
ncbi:glutathione S-transferase family protein [Methylobrevis albus]|uniref:Glutathione S-transferase family protein n=1 Tax=Methylobrevis albus TaxID=2793297 RepID=A0A931MYM5_9HYPH|nr:glutathione S-transferase family protein [Methylobrevis albus]MBH0236876.1 glutathione S-transferase family protein [Methylobrevis albus]